MNFDGPGGYLDRQFRLLRDDALGPVLSGLRQFSMRGGSGTLKEGQSDYVAQGEGEKIHLRVYRKIIVEKFEAVKRKGEFYFCSQIFILFISLYALYALPIFIFHELNSN